jgi:hypothetical protein
VSCAECRELTSHAFRSPDDLIHALRLAAEECERGVLARADERRGEAAQEALESSLRAGALPGSVAYRFSCQVCGDRFVLEADVEHGAGSWTREGEAA